jgi:argininosuccinate lyase
MLATDLAEYLVIKGVPFREAHGAVGRLSKHCADEGRPFTELGLKVFKKFHAAFDKDVLELLTPQASARRRISPGGTGTDQVLKRLAGLRGAGHG